jgi:hypothetical protein
MNCTQIKWMGLPGGSKYELEMLIHACWTSSLSNQVSFVVVVDLTMCTFPILHNR